MPQKLKIAVKPTFSAPIVMRVPGDNGEVTEVRFEATFRRLTRSENEALQKRLGEHDISDAQLLDLVLADWSGLVDDQGLPFVCSPENRAAASEDWQNFDAAIVYGYFEHAYPAAVKN